MSERPYVLYAVVEVTVDDDMGLFTHIHNLYRSREKAEQNAEGWREAWEEAGDADEVYDRWQFEVQEVEIPQRLLGEETLMDEETHEIRQKAAGAVGAALLRGEKNSGQSCTHDSHTRAGDDDA